MAVDPNLLKQPKPLLDQPRLKEDKLEHTDHSIGINFLITNPIENLEEDELQICKIIKVFPKGSSPKVGSPLSLDANLQNINTKPTVQAIGINITSRDQFIPFPANIFDKKETDIYTEGLFTYVYSDDDSIVAKNLKVNDTVYVKYVSLSEAKIMASKPTSSGRSNGSGGNGGVPASSPTPPTQALQNNPESTKTLGEVQSPPEVDPNRQYDAILIFGLSHRPGDLNNSQQLELFKQGYGPNKNVIGFSYTQDKVPQIKEILQNNNIPLFMFSKGCERISDLIDFVKDKRKIIVIEPWNQNNVYLRRFQSALSKGMPASNFYVGSSYPRGSGLSGASSSNSQGHFNALKTVGQIKSNI